LNLYGQANKDIVDCYSPAQVVKAKEYQQEKEAQAAVEEQAKYQRKIQRAANALRNKQERAGKDRLKAIKDAAKQAKDAEKKLARDLAAVNKARQEGTSQEASFYCKDSKNCCSNCVYSAKAFTSSKAWC
jgi:hypothetical protein